MVFFEEIGQAILSYVKETYSPGSIILCIDPYVWEECTSEIDGFTNHWNDAKRNLRVHFNIANSNNNLAKLALASFQIQLYNDASSEDAFNESFSQELGINKNKIQTDYYRQNHCRGETMQEKIFLGTKKCLDDNGFKIDFGNYASSNRGQPYFYVNFPKSQSLCCLTDTFKYSDCKRYWPQIWLGNGWSFRDAEVPDFKNEFMEWMQSRIDEKYFSHSGSKKNISLISNYLYGYFSQIWNDSVVEQERDYEKYDCNDFEVFNFKIENDSVSCELRKNGIIQSKIPEHIFCKPREKKNSIFKLDKEYRGFASQVRNVCHPETYVDDDFFLFMKEQDITQEMHENGISIYNIIDSQNKIIQFHGLSDKLINMFNIRTGEPVIEYIGGLKRFDKSRCMICLDFAIPKIKINAQEMLNLTIDGRDIELNDDKIVDISDCERDKVHIIRFGRIYKFKILSQNYYYEFSEKKPTCSGWIIEKGKTIKIANGEEFKGCRVDGLVGYGLNDNDYGRILYTELNRFNTRNIASEGNTCIESWRKNV